jgi:hypothetical protein
MENLKQKIELEYAVAFGDGFKPRAGVYYVNDKGEVCLTTILCTPEVITRLEADRPVEWPAFKLFCYTGVKSAFFEYNPQSGIEQELQEVQEVFKSNKVNLIKVQGPDQVEPAAREHMVRYSNQFGDLANEFHERMIAFLEQHPGYFPGFKLSKEAGQESSEYQALLLEISGSKADESGKQGENQ